MSQLEVDKLKTVECVFYGANTEFQSALTTAISTDIVHVNFILEKSLIKPFFQKSEVAILFIFSQNPQEIYEILSLKDAFQKDTQAIVCYPHFQYSFIQELQEHFEIFRLLHKDRVDENLIQILKQAVLVYQEKKDNKNLFVKFHQKNKKWKDLTQRLGKLEQEKIDFLSQAKSEENKKRVLEKRLKRFITNLSYVSNVDTYTKSIFREVRKRTEVQGLYIFVEHHLFGQVLYALQRGYFVFKRLSSSIRDLDKLDTTLLRAYIADELDRPFLRIEKKSLDFKNARQGFIIFELEGKSILDIAFVDFWSQVNQAIAMILDRLLLRLEIENARSIWEKAFESLNAPLVILDKDSKIVKMNKAFLQIQSYDLMLFLIENHKNQKRSFLEWKTHQQNFKLLAYPVLFEHPHMDSILYFFQDQKEVQETYSRRVQTEKMAALGLLAGNIAHELSNPFAGLKSMTQLLLSETEYAVYREDLSEILTGVNRCLQTIENLQNFTSDNTAIKQEIDTSDLIQKTIPLLKAALRNYQVNIQLKPNLKTFGNFHLLQQVIFNLIHNACQAMGTRGQLSIDVQDTGTTIRIAVRDSGKGILPEDLPFVFEPFFTTKELGEGTGLGLSICKTIVESHGGQITVSSIVDQGTIFTIILPKL